jgi:hypothetical protein
MIAFLFVVIVLGCVAYLLEHYLPMDPVFRFISRVVIGLILIWYLLRLIGVPWPAGPLTLR